jgi:hypothetical protein
MPIPPAISTMGRFGSGSTKRPAGALALVCAVFVFAAHDAELAPAVPCSSYRGGESRSRRGGRRGESAPPASDRGGEADLKYECGRNIGKQQRRAHDATLFSTGWSLARVRPGARRGRRVAEEAAVHPIRLKPGHIIVKALAPRARSAVRFAFLQESHATTTGRRARILMGRIVVTWRAGADQSAAFGAFVLSFIGRGERSTVPAVPADDARLARDAARFASATRGRCPPR